ncbi:hypothetical protein CI105_07800 [Candidatus Izimaplasma bacterium ZiA1]|uniref:TetR/AcrR family transcriptional regulator n=1 Tax=Candidatus Izimoplasma sp. ZiA1 TaxID=2024899 RepID=UPI000BAA8E5D|nr:hypothetical protein CI105_07800 [Candidatus Izimaplasma bacterium ZiA1]
MGEKTKYLEELMQEKDERSKNIISAAKELFDDVGIINAKMSKIAKRAKVGEVTVYRYFKNKMELATAVANSYWNETTEIFEENYTPKIIMAKNGLAKIKLFLEVFIMFYEDRKPFLKYMHDYDIYMKNNNVTDKKILFDDNIVDAKNAFIQILKEGQIDGSIKLEIDPLKQYSFVSEVMAGTTTKLALRYGYLPSESDFSPVEVITKTIDMFINYIKN